MSNETGFWVLHRPDPMFKWIPKAYVETLDEALEVEYAIPMRLISEPPDPLKAYETQVVASEALPKKEYERLALQLL